MVAELRASIDRLRSFDAQWQARNPGEKPPLGNGLRLTAWQDAAVSCHPMLRPDGNIDVRYRVASAPGDGWTDRLLLAPGANGAAVVTDIRYDQKSGGGFRDWIAEMLQTAG